MPQSVMIRDVPWAIPLREVSEALSKQGINAVSIERVRQIIKVEVKIYYYHYCYI